MTAKERKRLVGGGGIRALMSRSRFTDRARIDPKQKQWIKENKGKVRTIAGMLDIIINFYRKHYSKNDQNNKLQR